MENTEEIVQPITAEQQTQVIKQTEIYIGKAAALFSMKLKSVEITFDLKGRTAGMYRVYGNKREIRYNPYIFSKYFDDNFNTTVPHEVAHYITDIIYGLGKIKPHGKEWKAVMHAFNADASVTSNYDLSGIPVRKQTLYSYQCDCREHQISSVRHKKIISKRGQYYCTYCKQSLRTKTKAAA